MRALATLEDEYAMRPRLDAGSSRLLPRVVVAVNSPTFDAASAAALTGAVGRLLDADPGVIAGRAAAPYLRGLADVRRASDRADILGDGVANDTAGLIALCAAQKAQIALTKKTYVYRWTPGSPPLVIGDGTTLDGQGGTLVLDFDATETDATAIPKIIFRPGAIIKDLRIFVPSGRIQRTIAHAYERTKFIDVTLEFEDQQPRYTGSDVSIQTVASTGTYGGVKFYNFTSIRAAYPVRFSTTDCEAVNSDLFGYYKGFGIRERRCKFVDTTTRGAAFDAYGDPGNNLFGNAPDDTEIKGVTMTLATELYKDLTPEQIALLRASGEHGCYLVGDKYPIDPFLPTTGTNVRYSRGCKFSDFNVDKAGQCSIKIKDMGFFVGSNLHASNCPATSTPGQNEVAFQIDYCTDFLLMGCSSTGYGGRPGGWASIWCNQCKGGRIVGADFNRPSLHCIILVSCERMSFLGVNGSDIPGSPIQLRDSALDEPDVRTDKTLGGHAFIGFNFQRYNGPLVSCTMANEQTETIRVHGTSDKTTGVMWDSPNVANFDFDVHPQAPVGMSPKTRLWLNKVAPRAWSEKVRRINDLIEYIEANGIVLGRLHIFGNRDQGRDLIDVLSPRIAMTASGGLVYSPHLGFAGDGATGYLRLGAVPTAVPGYTRDDALVLVHCLTSTGRDSNLIGHDGTTQPAFLLNPRTTTDLAQVRLNGTTTFSVANTDGRGVFIGRRPDATAVEIWKDGALLGAGANASSDSAPGVVNVFRNAGSGAPYDGGRTVGAFAMGAASGVPASLIPGLSTRIRAAVLALA